MARLTRNTLFKASVPRAETLLDKTTRVVRGIIDEETQQRDIKNARLRKARLEREAATSAKPPKAAPKKPAAKAARKA